MNSQQKSRTKGIVLLLLLPSLGLNSCKKSNETNSKDGPTRVIVKMLGVAETNEPLATGSGAAASGLENKMSGQAVQSQSEGIQKTIVPFNKDISIMATLVPERIPAGSEINGTQTATASARLVTDATTPIQTQLGAGVKYKVLAYDDAGNLAGSKDFVHGQDDTSTSGSDWLLDAGKSYTFVACSINSTTTNVATPSGSLSSATTANVTGDLMYFRTAMTLTPGENDLNIVLKHQFSQITTNVSLDASATANITAIGTEAILPVSPGASIKLSDGKLTYLPATIVSIAIVNFNAIAGGAAKSVSSPPKLIISPLTTEAVVDITSITIKKGGTSVMKTNLSFANLRFTPGVKYNFNLKIVGA